MVLAQAKVEGKSNAITTLPALLDLLDVQGRTVTLWIRCIHNARPHGLSPMPAGPTSVLLRGTKKHCMRMSHCIWTIPTKRRPSRSRTPTWTPGMAGSKPAPHRCVMTLIGWGYITGRPWRRLDRSQHNARYGGNRGERPAPFLGTRNGHRNTYSGTSDHTERLRTRFIGFLM